MHFLAFVVHLFARRLFVVRGSQVCLLEESLSEMDVPSGNTHTHIKERDRVRERDGADVRSCYIRQLQYNVPV